MRINSASLHLLYARHPLVQLGGLLRLHVAVDQLGNFGRFARGDLASRQKRRLWADGWFSFTACVVPAYAAQTYECTTLDGVDAQDGTFARGPKLYGKPDDHVCSVLRREVSRSTNASSFPPQPSKGPGLLAQALRVVCIAQLAH
jgi:hypothetical protein